MVELYDSYGIKIYVDHNKTTIKGIDLQKKLAKFFLNKKVPYSLISIFDIANNFDIQKRIKDHCKRIPRYPYIEINGQLWGEGIAIEDSPQLNELISTLIKYGNEENENNKIVDAFISDKIEDIEEIEQKETLSVGYLDSGLNILEWISFGLVSNIWNPWSTPIEPVNDEADFECDTIRTNWYGRHQYRKYRFTPTEIYRIHNNLIRTTLHYRDIQQLILVDKKNIIIKILNIEDQYIQALEDDIIKMIDTITSRAYLVPDGESKWISNIVTN
ncbi:hypothetical protein DICPUDRAFT_45609 [Dictyostelium purpureum]|uniref:Glutaredoxin domain-containing protein n=1 Tax=Dictyostelium purpureum TaxID=5786 RepID=F0ZB19_DICPU|nr:uncharacterized protein DICPUDRAFT_45609 [Dictyostelium purpureum]EGC38817.1 hypothetical protein DICPUDRAFT_45609 [Dictyostelium purpureum]|eukprot:XP_003284611.1 hypothetical protein DICPUDRAFT_45609 [Dictyostelium purpureum]